jgi:hypothetical protein
LSALRRALNPKGIEDSDKEQRLAGAFARHVTRRTFIGSKREVIKVIWGIAFATESLTIEFNTK